MQEDQVAQWYSWVCGNPDIVQAWAHWILGILGTVGASALAHNFERYLPDWLRPIIKTLALNFIERGPPVAAAAPPSTPKA